MTESSLPRVVLRPRRARPFYGRHPWVFPGAIAGVEGEPDDGDVVDLYADNGQFVARGLFNSRSKIRVRLYSWSAEVHLDLDFFRKRIISAVNLRESILQWNGPRRACRLVYSEADGVSGLTVDRYDRWLVVQFSSLALAQRRELFANILTEIIKPAGIYLRTEKGIGELEGLELQDGLLRGEVPAEPVEIEDNGLRLLVDLAQGQKTGYYLDQRENRRAVAPLTAGRRVLDAFCYTGGFGLHASQAGAREIVGLDASESALALARENARVNGFSNLSFVQADVFEHLDMLGREGNQFGVVILDPPKFARSKQAVEEALRAYRRLQGSAIRLLEDDGILVTCCCSGLISLTMLEDLLAQLAAETGREIQILQRRGQAADHPVSVACPESNYLKCLICRVSGK